MVDSETYRKVFARLQRCEETSKRNDKFDCFKDLSPEEEEFLKFYFESSFNPYLTYGVASIPGSQTRYPVSSLDSLQLKWLRDNLVGRLSSGNMAKADLSRVCNLDDPQSSKWFRLMWSKNLKIGFSSSSVNKLFPGLIPEFRIMKCAPIGDVKPEVIEGRTWYAEPKFDGFRSYIVLHENADLDEVLSSNGKPLYNCEHIVEDLRKVYPNGGVVIDGELIANKNWNDTASLARSSVSNVDAKTLMLKAFDILSLSQWDAKYSDVPLTRRKELLRALDGISSHIERVTHAEVHTVEGALNVARLYQQKGYEGAVIKQANSVYDFTRSHLWIKVKFVETRDVIIKDFIEGRGKLEGTLGALLVDLDGKAVQCGSGLTDKVRRDIWNRRDELMGQMAEIKFQEKTKDGSARFPIFVRLREDKDAVTSS